MATPKRIVNSANEEVHRVNVSTSFKNQQSNKSWLSRHKVLLIFLAIGVLFLCWYGSDDWPWPSEERREKRLEEVVDVCTTNDKSTQCKELLTRWNISFGYCYRRSFSDTLSKPLYSVDENGVPQKNKGDLYAVAWEGAATKPEDTIGPNGIILYSYTECKKSL